MKAKAITFRRIARRSAFGGALAILASCALCGAARAELPRRINVTLGSEYYVLDSEFFGLSNAYGMGGALRYELASDIYFENGIGALRTDGDGVSVGGFDYHLSLLALFPVLIPYRPIARLGIGFLSVNPVTVTPTSTFRPAQTTFYFIGGAGISRSVHDRLSVEACANFWITPYEYRIYRFNRLDVDTSTERFTHLSISLGVAYAF
jgi:hypothetical protein